MLEIRHEKTGDEEAVRLLNDRAFDGPGEGRIVDRIRLACDDFISLFAVDDDTVVGHILFSPAVIDGDAKFVKGMGLAPMSVAPERHGEGIGSKLVRTGIGILVERGCPFVVVLGHPGYYPRFGFEPASRYRVYSSWEGVPDEAFMLLVLDERAMADAAGVARYRPEFDDAI